MAKKRKVKARKPLSLHEAQFKHGLVVKVKPTDDYNRIELMLSNAGNSQIRVDCLGTVLKPDQSNVQRLFVLGGEERDVISVAPGQKMAWNLRTVCMDEAKNGPSKDVSFEPSETYARGKFLNISRQWRNFRDVLKDSQGDLPEVDRPRDIEWAQQAAWGHADV